MTLALHLNPKAPVLLMWVQYNLARVVKFAYQLRLTPMNAVKP